jgi:spore germination protein YaaH
MSHQRIPHVVFALVIAGGLIGLQGVEAPAHTYAPTAAAASAAAPVSGAMSLKREVFGFALASSLGDPNFGYPSWNFSALSTVAFFGLHIDGNGAIVGDSGWSVWNSSTLTSLLSTAHAANTKVVLTIILQDFQPGTPTMCAGLANRATTVAQAVAQVNAKHVDGINVDYEGLNGTCSNGQTSQSMLTDFARQLRSAMPSPAYLSFDTYASSAVDTLGFFDIAGLNAYVDSFFVMAYDLEYSNWRRSPTSCVSFCLGPTAPLSGYYYNDTSSASQYAAVVGASKVLLGVPYYGRKACVGGGVPNAYPIGAVTADTYLDASSEATDPAVTSGSYAVHRDANDPAGQERWDSWYNASLGCTRELYWDDATSLGLKYDLVNRAGLRGVGIWNLNYGGGAPELWSALLSHFAGCQSVTATSSPISPAAVGTPVTLTAAASGCANANPRYAYWLQAPGSSTWQLPQQYSTNPSFAWNTTGLAAGTYRFVIWALDAASNGLYANSLGRFDTWVELDMTLTPTPCTGLSATFAPANGTLAGNAVTVTATAYTCPHPRYQFELLSSGSQTWRVVQPYSSNATFNWTTTGAAAGTYRFIVKAQDTSSAGLASSSLGTWDVYVARQYTLTRACTGLTLTTSPSGSAPAGARVSVTATAYTCPSPVYQFEVLAPGSQTWQVAQAYSSNPTLSWSTSGLAAGVYTFSVLARDAYSPGLAGDSLGSWDVYVAEPYSLVTPCSGAAATFAPATSAKAGTSVSITASASGCTGAQYQFEMLAPGSQSWQVVRAYSSSATYTWNTTGAPVGAYRFIVKVRNSSGTGAAGAGNPNGTWDAYTTAGYTIS